MKLFAEHQIHEALKHAAAGGQALHVFSPIWAGPRKPIPLPFKRTSVWAHLLDQDKQRLVETARKLGVKIIVVECEGRLSQHVDLCGRPLQRATRQCQGGLLWEK